MSFSSQGIGIQNRKPRDTQNNRQVLPWSAIAGQKLTEYCQKNTLVTAKHPFPTTKRQLYTWTSPDSQYQNQIMFFAAEDGKALYRQQKQDLELTVAQIVSS